MTIPLTLAPVESDQEPQSAGSVPEDSDDESAREQWTFDWDEMEQEAQNRPNLGLVMLCNPHNPVGRIFSKGELRRLGEFCEQHDLLIVSDEIHCDLILPEGGGRGGKHIPLASLDGGRFAKRTITLNAPSKVRVMQRVLGHPDQVPFSLTWSVLGSYATARAV